MTILCPMSVHWSVISGFFSWAAGMGYIEKSPIPNPKINPQFRIRYEKTEVEPPTKKQVEKILAAAKGLSQDDATKYGLPKPERRPVIQGKVIRGNRTKTNERYRVRISESLAKQLEALGEPAFPYTLPTWRGSQFATTFVRGMFAIIVFVRHWNRVTSVPSFRMTLPRPSISPQQSTHHPTKFAQLRPRSSMENSVQKPELIALLIYADRLRRHSPGCISHFSRVPAYF